MNSKQSISIIFPVYNEEGGIEELIGSSVSFLRAQNIFEDYEIVVVDDGSKDKTSDILRNLKKEVPCLKVAAHDKNKGYGAALALGFRKSGFPLVFFMDADGQFKIDYLKEALTVISDYDIVTGYRLRRMDPFFRVFLGKAYALLMFFLFGLKFKDINCGFKLFKREVIEENYKLNRGLFCAEFLLKAKNKGFKIKEIPIKHFPRVKGKQTGASLKVVICAIAEIFKLYILI